MWFGTDNGLARFDGRRIQNFSLGSSDANHITALKTAAGELWITTRGGAFVYSEDRFRQIEGTENVGITAILLGPEVSLGTDSGNIFRVTHNENGSFEARNLLPETIKGDDGSPLGITCLAESNGRLLAGTSGRGVFLINGGEASEYQTIPRPLFVNAIASREGGELWFGTAAAKGVSGVFRVSGPSVERIVAPTADILALEAHKGGVWAGAERYGLFEISESKKPKNATFENTSGGLRSNTIYSIFTDREGVVWIGTNRGVSRYDPQGPFQENVSDIPNGNFIRALWVPMHRRLAGSNRGLFEYDGEKWNRVPSFEEKAIYAISQNDSGIIVGTSSGAYDKRGRQIASGDTRSIANFGKTYAAILGRGVVDISSGRQTIIFPDVTASSLLADRERLWIGTANGGLYSFDGKNVKDELSPEALKSGSIWAITRDVPGNIWIAGQHGVFRTNGGDVERVIEVEDVRDVFVDGPNVWAATTTRGLMHARRDERFGWLVSAVGFEQGLPSEKAFAILPIDDTLLIATNRGVVTYRPGTVAPKLIATRVSSQRVHDLSELRSTIELEYPQNSLLIEVAGQSSRTFPEEFQYAYVLKNSKGEVVDKLLSSDAQYAPVDLRAGDYRIEVTAFDRDLNASEPLNIAFTVARAPFPWTATALGLLLAIAVVALIWAVVERRRIVLRSRELAAARFDLANEAERERSRIARDLHDQTLADLRDLMMKSDKTLPPAAGFRDDIESISTEIRRICEDLSPSVLENVGLVASLEDLLSHTFARYEFDARGTAEEEIVFAYNVQLQIYRIAQEVLSNISAHSDATHVEMAVEINDGQFALAISDDGAPFAPEVATHKGRGIANIRARASLINAHVTWAEGEHGGNRFLLTIDT